MDPSLTDDNEALVQIGGAEFTVNCAMQFWIRPAVSLQEAAAEYSQHKKGCTRHFPGDFYIKIRYNNKTDLNNRGCKFEWFHSNFDFMPAKAGREV